MQLIQEELNKVTSQPESINRIWTLRLTGKYCEKHDQVQFEIVNNGDEDICPECWRLEIQRQDEENAFKTLNKSIKGSLADRSVFSDKSVLEHSFEAFNAIEQEQKDNLIVAKEAIKVILSKDEYGKTKLNNIWLTGAPGTGKTFLAMSLLQELNKTDLVNGCIFVSFDEAIRLIRDGYNNKENRFTSNYFVKLCTNADYLVLDDIGAEIGAIDTDKRAADDVIKILYAITNARQTKTTIFTTNLSKPQLEKIYDKKLISRMLSNHKIVRFIKTLDQRAKEADF